MSELQNKLNLILNEKNTKIVPGNIKAGVNIFNITGNLQPTTSSSVPLLFMRKIYFDSTGVPEHDVDGITYIKLPTDYGDLPVYYAFIENNLSPTTDLYWSYYLPGFNIKHDIDNSILQLEIFDEVYKSTLYKSGEPVQYISNLPILSYYDVTSKDIQDLNDYTWITNTVSDSLINIPFSHNSDKLYTSETIVGYENIVPHVVTAESMLSNVCGFTPAGDIRYGSISIRANNIYNTLNSKISIDALNNAIVANIRYSGYYTASSQISMNNLGLANVIGLTPNKLVAGTTILNIVGNYTSDANAIATDITYGKTAYVNGVKIIGASPNLEPIVIEQENIITNLQSTVNNLQNTVNNKCLPNTADTICLPSSYIYSNLPNTDLSFKGIDFSNINAIGAGINQSNISICNSFLIAHCANLVNISDINFNNTAFTSTSGIQNSPYLALNCLNVRRFSNIAFPFLSTILHPILATNISISTGQQFFENIFLPNLTNISTYSIFWGNSAVPIEVDGLFLNKYNGSNPIIDNIPVKTLKNIYAPNISNIKMLCNNGLVQNAVFMNLNLCGIMSTATGLAGISNLQTFSMVNLYNVSNAELMFASCTNLKNVEFHNVSAGVAPLGWGQSNVHVAKMLYGCNNLSDLSIYNVLNYFLLMSQSNRLNTQCKSLNAQNGNSPFFTSNIITRAEQLASCAQILANMLNNGWTY